MFMSLGFETQLWSIQRLFDHWCLELYYYQILKSVCINVGKLMFTY